MSDSYLLWLSVYLLAQTWKGDKPYEANEADKAENKMSYNYKTSTRKAT